MRKIFHVAVNTVWFKKSQRKWDFLLQLLSYCGSPCLQTREDSYLSNCMNSRGGAVTMCRVDFQQPSLKFFRLFTFNFHFIILTEYFLLSVDRRNANCKATARLIPSKIQFFCPRQCPDSLISLLKNIFVCSAPSAFYQTRAHYTRAVLLELL